MKDNKILVVEDEDGVRFGISRFLESQGYDVAEAASCREARQIFQRHHFEAVLLDYCLPDGTALELLQEFKGHDPAIPLVLLTAHGSIDLAVRAIKEGAEQFLIKPVELPALLVVLQRSLENQRTRRKQLADQSRNEREQPNPFLGTSAAIRRLEEQARQVLSTNGPVLIQGETGTGKGVLARWLHDKGARAAEAFVDINCAGLSGEFLETELFGHEKGAFTGAVARKSGLLETAHRGTVFLDEIGDVDLRVQPKLLKVLEDKRFRRLGQVHDLEVDIRLIAATNQDLNRLVQERAFRSDLYFRISTIPLVIPPLRERVEDILPLARHFFKAFSADVSGGDGALTPEAEKALQTYPWPGNIRELRNILERATLLGKGKTLDRHDLPFNDPSGPEPWEDTAKLTLRELERRYIQRVLHEEHGHVGQAAMRLGVPRSSLYQKIARYGLSPSGSHS